MAEGLLEAGCEVVLIGTKERGTEDHPGALDVAEYYCDHEMKAHGLAANLSTLEAGEEAFEKAINLLGGELDIIVIAHGIQRRHMSNEFPREGLARCNWYESGFCIRTCQTRG